MHLYRPVLSSIAAIASTTVIKAVSMGTNSLGHESISVRSTSQKFKDTNLRYVKNSGVCETTLGVTQYSGYVEVGKNMSMVSSFVVVWRLHTSHMIVILVLRGSPLTRDSALYSLVRYYQITFANSYYFHPG